MALCRFTNNDGTLCLGKGLVDKVNCVQGFRYKMRAVCAHFPISSVLFLIVFVNGGQGFPVQD